MFSSTCSSFNNAIILIANASVSASSFDEAVLALCFGGMSLALIAKAYCLNSAVDCATKSPALCSFNWSAP